jgi:hypothetical protein
MKWKDIKKYVDSEIEDDAEIVEMTFIEDGLSELNMGYNHDDGTWTIEQITNRDHTIQDWI